MSAVDGLDVRGSVRARRPASTEHGRLAGGAARQPFAIGGEDRPQISGT